MVVHTWHPGTIGPSFATITPADVLTMDFNGNVLEHDPSVKPYVNETIHLHGVIHRYNPHITAVAHTHPPNTITWTTFRKLPQTFDQESCLLADDIAIVDEDFTGLAQSEDQHRSDEDASAGPPRSWQGYRFWTRYGSEFRIRDDSRVASYR